MMKIAIIVVVGAQLLLRSSWVLAEANILVSTTNNPQETSIAINPTNPNNILASSQPNLKYHVSFDGGQTWSEGPLPDLLARSDPVVAFGPNGVAYYSFIGPGSHSGVFVNRSVDGGLSWQPNGAAVIEHSGGLLFEDKPYITTDITGSEYRSNVYIAWTQFDALGSFSPQDSTRILFSRSTDQGVSFCAPIRVSDLGGDAQDSNGSVMGAIPAVGHDGTVYVAWTGPRGIEFDKSEDGGCNFGQDTVVSDRGGPRKLDRMLRWNLRI